jgi:hypothetical protein
LRSLSVSWHLLDFILVLVILFGVALAVGVYTITLRPHSLSFDVSYTGINYYDPANYYNSAAVDTTCPNWTWLQARCYGSTSQASHRSMRRQLDSDLAFISRHHLGSFQRVWVSLDQLMYWHPVSGYAGYNPRSLANLDDALQQFARYHMKVDLVLLTYSLGSSSRYQFHPEALDGLHPQMRANYLRAVHDFVAHLAANPVDASTIAVMDLENEAYYQLEVYFSNTSHLGVYRFCETSGGHAAWSCVDRSIIHPWLTDLYRTAKAAGPRFLYTISDVGYLLDDYRYWQAMYPVDVYDIHAYRNHPWEYASFYRRGLRLRKPWFVGEAGCAPMNIHCTYNGTNAVAVDRWWLNNLRKDGARAVLIESATTLWHGKGHLSHERLTKTGRLIEAVTLAGNS